MIFCNENRVRGHLMVCLVSAFSHSIPLQPIVKEENPEASFGEMGKLLGAKWKELDDAGKKVCTGLAWILMRLLMALLFPSLSPLLSSLFFLSFSLSLFLASCPFSLSPYCSISFFFSPLFIVPSLPSLPSFPPSPLFLLLSSSPFLSFLFPSAQPYSDKAEEDKKRYEKEQGSYSAKAGGGEEEEDEE